MLIKVNEPPARRGVELAHVPAKACPALDAGWTPVRHQEHAPNEVRDEQRANAGAEDERPDEGTT
jgi:hypothetical protein